VYENANLRRLQDTTPARPVPKNDIHILEKSILQAANKPCLQKGYVLL
jgi:hypothetical protein